MTDISIPVTVDDVKDWPAFSFARCSYFTIECDAPVDGWTLEIEKTRIPFLMLGLSGIVLQPSLDSEEFRTSQEIEDLFTRIEASGRLYVGTADIWLPTELLQADPRELCKRGATFRVGHYLFVLAFAFRCERIGQREFKAAAQELHEQVGYSDEEDNAFRDWRDLQVRKAIDTYPKDPDLALEWHSAKGRDRKE